ncbi:MAG TPA: hypothetical protein VFL90_00965 [Methylomirabilota bacterium]|nr:hypothetical protein [Methylomirabilota bacterium]
MAVALLALALLARGENALTNAYVDNGLRWDDPTTLDLGDVNGLILKTVTYSDPMAPVRQGLLVVLRPSGRVASGETCAVIGCRPEPNRPRAPPAA